MSPHTILSLVHVFLLAPLLYVIATTKWIPPLVVAAIGAFITLYHAYKAYTKLAAGQTAWVNLIHATLVGPILLYTGLARNIETASPRWSSEVILMFAFAAAGYHVYYLIAAPQ